MKIIDVDTAPSSSSLLAEMIPDVQDRTVVRVVDQTAGRGQRGNTWEAEAGKNLTFSMYVEPEGVDARRQFYISQAVSVAILDVLRRYVPENETVAVKWPNDIYVGDQKICGVLIENSLSGSSIGHSILGIGINVNQREFRSDAPNPVSLIHFTGRELPLSELLYEFCTEIDRRLHEISTQEGMDRIHAIYLENLWRGKGFYTYATPDGLKFEAEVIGVAPDGILSLRDPFGIDYHFAFKEVHFIL